MDWEAGFQKWSPASFLIVRRRFNMTVVTTVMNRGA
jgi:hypothetical protein